MVIISYQKYVLLSIIELQKSRQALMNGSFQSISDHSNEEQKSNRQNQGKQQSNEPLKTKQINKGRPKKKVDKVIPSSSLQLGLQSSIQIDNIDEKQSKFSVVVLSVQGFFIDFFEEINERKGFVYCRQYREKLNKSRPLPAQWTSQQNWDPEKEMEKLDRKLPWDEKQNHNLKRLIMEISSLHASEFTEEFYDIFLRLYSILKQGYPIINRVQIEQLAAQISSNEGQKYIFFSRQFRQRVKSTKKFPYLPLESNEAYKTLLLKSADAIKSFLFD